MSIGIVKKDTAKVQIKRGKAQQAAIQRSITRPTRERAIRERNFQWKFGDS